MINFMRFKYLYFLFSAIFLVVSLFSIIKLGFEPSIEFTGGTLAKFEIQNLKFQTQEIKIFAEESGIESPEVKTDSDIYTLKSKIINLDSYETFKTKINEKFTGVKLKRPAKVRFFL